MYLMYFIYNFLVEGQLIICKFQIDITLFLKYRSEHNQFKGFTPVFILKQRKDTFKNPSSQDVSGFIVFSLPSFVLHFLITFANLMLVLNNIMNSTFIMSYITNMFMTTGTKC